VARDDEAHHDRQQRSPAEPEQRGGRDVFRDCRLQFGRYRRHRGDLHEVEIIKQADPHDAKQDMQEAEQPLEVNRGFGAAVEGENDDDKQRKADKQRITQRSQKFGHGPERPLL